jgi:hypothetical protein
MIDFTRAFDSAWERTLVILFRPFNLGKWCAIGLSAFLAGLMDGGNGVNGSSFNNNNDFSNLNKITNGQTTFTFNQQQLNSTISNAFSGMQLGIVIFIVLIVFVLIFALIILFYWLGARGQFMFLDNVVRNRGAIAWPWRYYARQSNSLFLFHLLLFAITMGVLLCLGGIALLVGIPLYLHHRWPHGGEITVFILLGLLYLAFCLVFGFVVFIFREFGVPLMFRNGLMARAAFIESLRLIKNHPGSIAIFVLLRIAIWLGVVILSVIVCCLTCCLAALPYVGTVFLLPVLVYVRCFSLDCLAQFGPQYDAWTVDVTDKPGI